MASLRCAWWLHLMASERALDTQMRSTILKLGPLACWCV